IAMRTSKLCRNQRPARRSPHSSAPPPDRPPPLRWTSTAIPSRGLRALRPPPHPPRDGRRRLGGGHRARPPRQRRSRHSTLDRVEARRGGDMMLKMLERAGATIHPLNTLEVVDREIG